MAESYAAQMRAERDVATDRAEAAEATPPLVKPVAVKRRGSSGGRQAMGAAGGGGGGDGGGGSTVRLAMAAPSRSGCSLCL